MSRKQQILEHNPTNLKVFNDISTDEEQYLITLQHIAIRIATEGTGFIDYETKQKLNQFHTVNVRVDWILSALVKTMVGRHSKSNKAEAELLLVALVLNRVQQHIRK